MMRALALLCLTSLLTQDALSVKVGASAVLTRDLDASNSLKLRPIMKVVRMLEDMKAELEKELEDDKAVNELMTCWCKGNNEEKTKAIEMGKAKSAQLEASMGEDMATIAELKETRAATLKELNNDKATKEEAATLRMKENKAFHAEEADLIEAIDACKYAITALSKHHPALAQVRSLAKRLQDAKVPQLVLSTGATLGKERFEALKAFLQGAQGASSFLSVPGFQSYAPQSGQIFGILGQMQEDFEATLSEEQKAELKAKTEYEALVAAKDDEIAAGEKKMVELDEQIADLQEKHAAEMGELEDTQKQLAMDEEFLKNLIEKCATHDAEFEQRVKDRLTEISAVEDTIKILNDDTAFENFDKTVNQQAVSGPRALDFLQAASAIEGKQQQEQRQRAVAVLQQAAGQSKSPRLALIAVSAQLDAFTKVKALIDNLVAELTKQQKDEVDSRDWCIKELDINSREMAAAEDKKAGLETKMADLDKEIKQLTKDIDTSKATVADLKKQMKRASETREAENADYQQTIVDQRLTQAILSKALARMKEVYALLQKPGAAHVATSGTHTDPGNGPARFKDYEENAGGKRVVAMIEDVIADSKKMEDEAIVAEQDGQTTYELFMKESNESILSLSEAIVNMSERLAKAKAEFSMAKSDHKDTFNEMIGLDAAAKDLHTSCDFLLKNFEARQAARAAEMDALGEAKAILSGMK